MPDSLVSSLVHDVVCDRLYISAFFYHSPDVPFERPQRPAATENIFLYIRHGHGSLTAQGNYKRFSAGQYFVVPAGEEYVFTPSREDPCELFALRFCGIMGHDIVKSSPHFAVTLDGEQRRDLERLLLQVQNCFERGLTLDNMRYASCIFAYALANLFYGETIRADEGNAHADEGNAAIEAATQYMRDHVENRIRLEELAAHAGYTPTYFSSFFRRKTGYSPITYFNIMKMQRACELLVTTDRRILDICVQLGIDDNYYFSRLFTKTIGMSPKQYRKLHTPEAQ
ncbi:MAG: AraC family transcriptional regulator [Bacteroidaceae bacterium]|nr:AraC family transcriptional regulator [Bacteroidaceae bacterium]